MPNWFRPVRGRRPDETIELLPGDYEVRVRDAWRVLGRGRARVEAGRTSMLVVEPVSGGER